MTCSTPPTTPGPAGSRPAFRIDEADAKALNRTVSRIAGIGYGESQVRDRLGLSDLTELSWRALPIYRRKHLATRDPLAAAIDLFLLQGAIPIGELDPWCDQYDRDVLVRAGILSLDQQGRVRAGASLFPIGHHLVFSDHAWPMLPHPGWKTVPHDQVMFIGLDSRWLARATVRRPIGSALDLCTGSGVHALLAAAHSQSVVAVDISPRAVDCARFNAQALGLTNLRASVGDVYQPVPGQRFDLITANPPFVPSPLGSLGYRDGGPTGEDVQRRIIEGLPTHLAPGGMAQIVTELGERDGEPLSDRLRAWLGGAPMNIYILRLREHSAENYAIGHAQGDDDYGAFLDSIGQWADNLRAQGYTRVVSVLLAFQWNDRPTTEPWTCSETAHPSVRDAGLEIEAAFSALDLVHRADWLACVEHGLLQRAGPMALLEARGLGADLPTQTQVRVLGRSLPIEYTLNPLERDLLIRLARPMALSELAATGPGLNADRPAVLEAIRSLLGRRLVVLKPTR